MKLVFQYKSKCTFHRVLFNSSQSIDDDSQLLSKLPRSMNMKWDTFSDKNKNVCKPIIKLENLSSLLFSNEWIKQLNYNQF